MHSDAPWYDSKPEVDAAHPHQLLSKSLFGRESLIEPRAHGFCLVSGQKAEMIYLSYSLIL